MSTLSSQKAKAAHERFRLQVIDLLRQEEGNLSAQEMLAIAAHFVGQLITMQDQRKLNPVEAMQLVRANIEQGNASVIASLSNGLVAGHG